MSGMDLHYGVYDDYCPECTAKNEEIRKKEATQKSALAAAGAAWKGKRTK